MDFDFSVVNIDCNLSKLNLREKMLEVTNKYLPFNGNANPLPKFAILGPPDMAMLSLLGFMIGLPIWLFSTYLIQNTQTIPPQLTFSPQLSSSS